jgi:hypothetical protein
MQSTSIMDNYDINDGDNDNGDDWR